MRWDTTGVLFSFPLVLEFLKDLSTCIYQKGGGEGLDQISEGLRGVLYSVSECEVTLIKITGFNELYI
jgi:hypothetical protein